MATNNKDFKIKNGLVVDGATATVGGNNVLTSASSVNDLSDVTVTDPTSGQVLKWNGSAWVNDTDATAEGGGGNTFETISANGTSIVADSSTDTLTITPGSGMSIVGNATSDTVTFSVDYAEKNYYLVRNNTGSTIPKGTLVSASGAEPSGRIDVAPHSTTGTQDSELRVMGMATANISNGVNGEVISFGTLVGIDTRGDTASAIAVGDETWAEGDILYAHPTVAGKLTNVRPQHDLAVAFITVRHASTGQIAVRIIPGNNHLEWLHDVNIDGTPADNELLAYNSENGTWINQTASEAGLSVVGHTHSLIDVTDVTASAAELNILDGATLSTTELNYVDGVTSAIQTQIDAKVNTADVDELARDAIGSALVAGSNVTITPDDGADTITIAASDPPSYNFLINGGFDIWQRGTSSTANDVYIADRWIHSRSAGTHTVSRSTDVPEATLQYSLSFAGTSTTAAQIQQRIESVNALPLVGKTVTFSIWAKSTVGTAALAWSTSYPTTTVDTFSALTTDQSGTFEATMTLDTWTRYSASFTVNANAVRGYAVNVFRSATTTSTTTLYAGAQLELGSVLNSFKRNAPSIQAELTACQRYYFKMLADLGDPFCMTFAEDTTNSRGVVQLPTTMRTAPAALEQTGVASDYAIIKSGPAAVTCTIVPTFLVAGVDSAVVRFVTAASLTAGHGGYARSGVANGFLAWSAEL